MRNDELNAVLDVEKSLKGMITAENCDGEACFILSLPLKHKEAEA